MNLSRLVRSDAVLSLGFHALKSFVALYVNWIVLRQFAVSDYVTWSVTSSILVIATASDLGIGQYAVTRLLHSDKAEWPAIIRACFIAMLPLSVVSLLFVAVAINGPNLAYKLTMASLLALRVLSIPFGAVLNAVNQFKIRKAIELGAYIVAAVMVTFIAIRHGNVMLALVALNITFFLGAALTIGAASRFISLPQMAAAPIERGQWIRIFGAATPFMANNLTSLLTYGGFIWISSLLLAKADVAKLALLHSFLLMNLYQLYDVFLKSRQADLVDPWHRAKLAAINAAVMVATPVVFTIAGLAALRLLSAEIVITRTEMLLFSIFMAFELGFLFIQSIAQVHKDLYSKLTHYSLVKIITFGAAIFGFLAFNSANQMMTFLAMLSLASFLVFCYASYKIWQPLIAKSSKQKFSSQTDVNSR